MHPLIPIEMAQNKDFVALAATGSVATIIYTSMNVLNTANIGSSVRWVDLSPSARSVLALPYGLLENLSRRTGRCVLERQECVSLSPALCIC